MYIAGFFYGAISIAQAYVEALSTYLAESRCVRVANDPTKRWRRLHRENIVSAAVCDAAIAILSGRNDFHHLNKQIEQEFLKLEARAGECLNHLYTIESQIFAYSFDAPGTPTLHKPEYWPSPSEGLTQVNLRQLW